ncbi:integrating conjugative element protein [Pseudomonas sp. PA15(2017)]|uniref:PFL_4669 family integrating conjugative element protein n=1 Tax=Pseudomonas sp. PA15(2017) TaxID=1932111 RepID=UPI0009662440|nr:TIGR03761 family integrating conjugative element protein [Pseudomonas sp. PA15(2017)]OLU25475.1 integrating conjugative element protein [Pseudomonas sp. PA15(2017)]
MADNFELNLGSLRSAMSITMHTHRAAWLWFGRRKNQDNPQNSHAIIGMPRFIMIMDQMKNASAQNDPYADHWLIRMEERLEKARETISSLQDHVDHLLSQVPPAISIEDNINIQPIKLPLYIGCQLGFIGIYMLTEYDTLARRVLLSHHVGMIGRKQMEQWLDQGAHEIRSCYGLAQQYRHAGVTRDDMAANNARAREALEKFGPLPQGVLDGTLRSNYAPALPQLRDGSDAAAEHVAVDDSVLEQSAVIDAEDTTSGA